MFLSVFADVEFEAFGLRRGLLPIKPKKLFCQSRRFQYTHIGIRMKFRSTCVADCFYDKVNSIQKAQN